jgi:hypothetical protein
MSYSVQQEKVYLRLRTCTSRFLIGLVTCFATHDGILDVQRPRVLPVYPVANAAQPREVAQALHYVRQPGDIRSLVVPGSAVHPIKILMDGGFSTPF